MDSSYTKGLVDSGKSCGVLVVSPLIALMHAYAGVFTPTSSVKPNPFANVTIKIDVIFTFKLNTCSNRVYQAFPPRLKAWARGYPGCLITIPGMPSGLLPSRDASSSIYLGMPSRDEMIAIQGCWDRLPWCVDCHPGMNRSLSRDVSIAILDRQPRML